MPSTKTVIVYRIFFFFYKTLHNSFRSQLKLFLTIYLYNYMYFEPFVWQLTCWLVNQKLYIYVDVGEFQQWYWRYMCTLLFFGHNFTLHRGSMSLQVPFKNQQNFLLVTTSIPGKKLVYVYGGVTVARVVQTVQYQPLLIFLIFWSLSWMFFLTFLIL